MTDDGAQADLTDDRAVRGAASPFATLAAGAPSCRVVQLLEEWHRWTCTQALRIDRDLRAR